MQPREVGQSLLTDCQPSHTPIVVPQPKVVDGCSRPKEELGPASLLHSPFLLPPLLVLSFEAAILPLSVGTAQDFWDLEPQYSLHHRQIFAFTIINSRLLAVPLLLFGLVLSRDKRKTENVFLWKIEDK